MHAASPSFILAIWAQGRLLAMPVAQAVGHGRRRLIQKQPPWLAALGVENVTQKAQVYLLTFARVLSDRLLRGDLKDVTELSRQDIFNFG